MATFAEFVAENYRSHMSLTWDYPRAGRAVAEFTAGDAVNVTVSFEQLEPTGPWHVAFEVDRSDTTEAVSSAFDVFNGVFEAVEEFIAVREPELVIFATKRDKLARIYDTYLRREAQTIESLGYELEGPIKVDPFTEYVLRRVKPSDSRQ